MSKLEKLQEELKTIEPTIDFLHEVCGCGQYAEITRTSDGFFLGRAHGDIGFNMFLGKPSSIALARARQYLKKLSPDSAALANSLLVKAGFGITFAVI